MNATETRTGLSYPFEGYVVGARVAVTLVLLTSPLWFALLVGRRS